MRKSLLAAAVSGCFISPLALANPTGPAVVSGTAAFATAGKTLTVTNSPGAIINWQGFSIGAGEATRFQQQSAASAVMNRVVGQDPSAILGTLTSNGRVFLLNPNGIVFGAGSVVNVAGLVATTLNLSDQDFLAGKLNFQAGAVAKSVVNQGAITAANGGFVYLIAPDVQNHGVIQTPQGQTILAAGRSVQLVEADVPELRVELHAGGEALNVGQILADGGSAGIYAGLINQQGLVRANSVSRDATGRIVFRSDVLNNTGSVQADGAQGGSVAIQARNVLSAGQITAEGSQGTGGEIDVQASGRILQTSAARLSADGDTGGGKVTLQAADRVFGSGTLSAIGQGAGSTGGEIKVLGSDFVLLGARLDASGNAGGGSVLIGGDFQGKNPAVQNAASNWINFSTTINADARNAGDGGKVIVWSDQETKFYGSISARGGEASGDGGFIEVSGKENLVFGGMADAGAPNGTPGTLLLDPKFIIVDSAGGGGGLSSFLLVDPNPGTSQQFAFEIVVLPNDNVVATDPSDNFAASGAGAVYLFNGATGALISTLTGSQAGDQVGFDFGVVGRSITALSNGNYVVTSTQWNNGAVFGAGAVTFGNGTTGVSGVVSAANSLVGSQNFDSVGYGGVTALTNGNYVVSSPFWANGAAASAGASTFGNGTTGVSGVVSAANSLVGTTAFDNVGYNFNVDVGATALSNGNYVVTSPDWNNGAATRAGAATFGNGTTGITGAVSGANSLVGSTTDDQVGNNGVTALINGNYVVKSDSWDNGAAINAGAATFGDGTTGISGAVSAANSLVGTTSGDSVGGFDSVTALTNGNYVVSSDSWDNGAVVGAGAATFGSGTTGISGAVSVANSLVGTTAGDAVGSNGVTALSNGNYVVSSSVWDNGATLNVGAVTFGDGTTGISGAVSAANSLVGTTANDRVGGGRVNALSNGNYVVGSNNWDNGAAANAGAATFGNGTTGISGVVSAANSLIGSTTGDGVGGVDIVELSNGNYVVRSGGWDNGASIDAGAATFGSGTTGVSGVISAANSLVSATPGDGIEVTALSNGNYVVTNSFWTGSTGAVTFGNGATGISGTVSAANSLVGSTANDAIGSSGVTALTNGNYVVSSPTWNNGAATNAGAVTFGNGTTGIVGAVSAANSLVGTTANDRVGNGGGSSGGITALSSGDYVASSIFWINGAAASAGAVTFGNGTTGISGAVSSLNSLVGTIANDQIGSGGVTPLSSGSVVVRSPLADNGAIVNAGLVHVLVPPGGGGFTNPLGFADSAAGATTITPAQITAITNLGTAVTLQANTDITLAVASAIITNNTGGNGGAITIQAGRSVLLNSSITTDDGNLAITANDPSAMVANRDAGAGGITMAAGTTLNAGTGMVTLTVGAGVPGAASGNLVVENITATDVNLQQLGHTNGSSILRASGSSLITATHLLMEVDSLGFASGGSVGTAVAPMRVAVSNLESHTHEASPGIFVDSPTQGLTIGGVPFFGGSVKGVQNVTSGDISITANGNLTTQAGTAGCGVTGGTGGPVCGGSITLAAGNGDLSIGNVVTHIGAVAGSFNALASNSILVGGGANITSAGGAFGITLNSDSDASGAGAVVLGNFAPLVTINSNGGNILIGGGTAAAGFAVGEGVNDIGIYLNGAALSSGAGNITLRGEGLAGLGRGVSMQTGSGSSIQSTSGDIAIFGNADVGAEPAIRISQLQTVTSTSGDIALTGISGGVGGRGIEIFGQVATGGNIALDGTGGAGGSAAIGIEVTNGGVVSASGSGTVMLIGQGGAGTDTNRGVSISGPTSAVNSVNGNITINATGGAGLSSDNVGLVVDSSAKIETTGSGSISITGLGGGGTNNNNGVRVSNSAVVSAGGTLTVDGEGVGGGADNSGIKLSGAGSTLQSIGLLVLAGQGGSGVGNNNDGIRLESSTLVSSAGAIAAGGTGGTGGSDTVGIKLGGGATVQSTGGGAITLIGQGGTGTDNNNGVRLENLALVSTAGVIGIDGTAAGSGNNNSGIKIDGGTVQSTGVGIVLLTGLGAAGVNTNDGIRLENSAVVSTTGGSIIVDGTGGGGSGINNFGVFVNASSVQSSAGGNLTITGQGGDGGTNENYGVLFNGSTVSSTGGTIQVSGTAGAGSGITNLGLFVNGGSVQTTGTGSINLIGQAGAGTNGNTGVTIGTGAVIAAANGAILISGTGAGSGVGTNVGVLLSASSITATGAQPIEVIGSAAGAALGVDVQGGMLGGASHSGDLFVRARGDDSINLNGAVNGIGRLFLEPLDAPVTIGIAGGAGTFNLASAELGMVANGFSQITIGHPSGAGLINLGSHTFNDPIIIRNTGSGSAGIVSSGTLSAGANDLNLLSAGLVNVTQGTVSGANIGINAGSLVVQPGVLATSSSLVNATGDLTVNASSVLLRGSDTSASLGAKLQAAGVITINTGSLNVEGGNANNASAAIDPAGITINATGNVTLTGGGGADAYALIYAPTGNVAINAPSGLVTLTQGTGLNANAAIVASLGTAQVSSAGCTGCVPLLSDPVSGPSLLASGIFGNPVTVSIVVPVAATAAVASGSLFDLSGLLNTSNAALIEMGDEEEAQSILLALSGERENQKDEQPIYSCR